MISSILFVNRSFYLDDSNGASVASRALLSHLARKGVAVEVLCGSEVDAGEEREPEEILTARSLAFRSFGGETWMVSPGRVGAMEPRRLQFEFENVGVTLHRRRVGPRRRPDADECEEFLRLSEEILSRLRPDVLLTYGGDPLTLDVLASARRHGIATVFTLHNFAYHTDACFRDVDAVTTPSRFAADYYRRTLGLSCAVLPNLVDFERFRVEQREPKYLTFVNPIAEKGVYPFVRIADELGRKRPDIPILVVESRGTETTLASCGLDLRHHGNVFLTQNTHDPRAFWSLTRVCLMPSLWLENQPLVAIEAMANGIPVIGSDRGGIPETLGDSGIVLPLPDRLTPATRTLPTAEEVVPWIDAVIGLWDDEEQYDNHVHRARKEAGRWNADSLVCLYERFFDDLRPGIEPIIGPSTLGENAVAVVVSDDQFDTMFGPSVTRLEDAGLRVLRRLGCSDLNATRSLLVSEAVHDGIDAVLILDPHLDFDPNDALRMLARPEPVIVGVSESSYVAGGSVEFANGLGSILFGPRAPGLYPLNASGVEFLRIRVDALRRTVSALNLPLCDANPGRGFWPFFQPMIDPGDGVGPRYLDGARAFYHRLRQAGITPMADTSVRLNLIGRSSPWARAATSWDQIPGMFDFAAVYDRALSEAHDEAIFVEVGCLAGRSTCYLATMIRNSGKAITLYAVDTCCGSETDETGRMIVPSVGGTIAGVLHRNLIGCGVEEIVVPILTTSIRAAELFPSESVEFCFIDADHRFESVLNDLRTWWPKIKPGGTLAGHDYRQSVGWLIGVTQAVHRFFGVNDAAHPLAPFCWSITKAADRHDNG